MILELLNLTNLKAKRDIEGNIQNYKIQNGVYCFLESGKNYNDTIIDEHFMSNHVSLSYSDGSKKVFTNELFKNEASFVSKYSQPLSANTQYGSQAGCYTILSQVASFTNVESMFGDKKGSAQAITKTLDKFDNFYTKFLQPESIKKYIEKKIQLTSSEMKLFQAEMDSTINSIFDFEGEDALKLSKNSEKMNNFLKSNSKFLENLREYLLKNEKKAKLCRVYIILDELDFEQATKEYNIYYNFSLIGNNKAVYNREKNEVELPLSLFNMFSKNKKFTSANQSHLINRGYEFFNFKDISNVVDLYFYLKFKSGNNYNKFEITIKDNKIIDNKVSNSETFFFKNEKSTISLLKTILNGNVSEKGIRQLNINIPYIQYTGVPINLSIKNYEELSDIIFGVNEDTNSMLFLSEKVASENIRVLSKFKESKTKFSNYYFQFKDLLQDISKYSVEEIEFSRFLRNNIKDLVYFARFNQLKLGKTRRFYKNNTYFWKTLEKEFLNKDLFFQKEELSNQFYNNFNENTPISNDSEFVFLATQLINYMMDVSNRNFKSINETREKYVSNDLFLILNIKNTKVLKRKMNEIMQTEHYILDKFKKEKKIKSDLKVETLFKTLNNYEIKNNNIHLDKDLLYLATFNENVLYKKIIDNN